MVNCSLETPYAEDFVRGLSPATQGLFSILFLTSLCTCGLFVDLWVYMNRHVSSALVKDRSLIVLGYFPVITIAAQVGMIVPRASTLVDLITSVYGGIALFFFFHLTIAYLGGEEEMLEKMQYVESSLSVPPCCCCCCLCLPKITIDRRIYTIFRICISQAMFLLPILYFINAVLWADGKYFKETVDVYNPLFYLGIVVTISALLCLYVFNVLIRSELKIADKSCHLLAKYVISIVTMVILSLQPLLLEVLAAYNVIPCTPEFHWQGRASEIHHMLKVAEVFLLMFLSRGYYRKPYPEPDTLYFDNPLQSIA